MNNLDRQYQSLLQEILDNGVTKSDRTGTGTKSIFSAQIKHNMKEGFPLLTTKKVFWKGIVSELLWFLRGDTNIKWLLENDNNIWIGDAYKNYCKEFEKGNAPGKTALVQRVDGKSMDKKLSKEEFIAIIKTDDEFAKKWGELGPIYGAQWRSWERYGYRGVQNGALDCGLITMEDYKKEMYVDQIQQAIHTLKTNPDSRRIIVNAWNVGELDNMVLPPCHWAFELYTEELTIEERGQLARSKSLCPKWHHFEFDKNGKEIPNQLSKTEHYDRHNIPKRRLSLKWHQRSVDLPLGLPFNIASYALLLEILAKEVNMVPGTLVGDLTNVHIYKNQIEGMMEQIERDPYEYDYPKLVIANNTLWGNGIDEMLGSVIITDFQVEGYESYPSIKMPLSN